MHIVRVHSDTDSGSWWAEDGEGYVAVSDSLQGIEELVYEGMSEMLGLGRSDVDLIRVETPSERPAG
ncbi:MAG: hypothetical protein OXP08_09185 [bacterium]|nr:hypothetical protein [bacterium]